MRRQLRVTPYPHEDAGWIVANAGDEVCLFSSDYPHVEGGRASAEALRRVAGGLLADASRRFYADNFIDLMGAGLAPDCAAPRTWLAAASSATALQSAANPFQPVAM